MGGGGSDSQNSSRPLSGQERADIYNNAMSSLSSSMPGMLNANGDGTYSLNSPQYQSPELQTLNGQDYNALQSSLLQGNTAGLDYAKGQDSKNMNTDLANRGIWSTGLAEQATKDLDASYAPQYAQAGANATQQRYGLQTQEQNAANTFNLSNSQQNYSSAWAPANYLQGVWNGTGGAISNGNSTSAQISI